MTPAQLQSYLAWINKGVVLGTQGDAFLGGPPGVPAPFPAYFDVTNPLFGAKGDSNPATDDSIPINEALTAAYNAASLGSTIAVFIPYPPPQANGSPGFYNLKQPLLMYHGSKLIGAEGGMWGVNLQWNADCNGIDVQNGGASLTGRVTLRNLNLSGNAPVSAIATKTIGINSLVTNFWDIQNVYVQDFVDQLVFDAASNGNGTHFIYNFITYNTSYPNATNGYPRYGIRLTGAANKVQTARFLNCYVSGVLSANSSTFTGDGHTTTFNHKPNSPLWQESGIKVYYVNGAGHQVKKSSAGGSPDYQLYDFTTGTNVLIPNGSKGSKSQNVNVVFSSAPANGQTILVLFSDPTLACGLYWDNANINYFEGGGVQGAITGVEDILGQNMYSMDNMEIIDTAWNLNGVRTYAYSRQYNNTVDTLLSSSTGTLITSQPGAGWDWTEIQATIITGAQTFTSGSATTVAADSDGSGLLGFSEYDFTNREVQVQFNAGLVCSGGGPVSATVTVQVSYDNANTFVSLGIFTVSGYSSAAGEAFYVPVCQTFVDRSSAAEPVGYGVPTIFYRTQIAITSGTSLTIAAQDDSTYYALRVRDVNLAVA